MIFILISNILLNVLLALALIWGHFRRVEQRHYISALEDSLEAGGAGIVMFDEKQRFTYSNVLAGKYLGGLQNRAAVRNLNDFIAYLFDHAVEGGGMASFMQPDVFGKVADFCEIVDIGDGYSYLVEMHTLEDMRTIVLIRDVSRMKAQDDDISVLNKVNEELSLAIEASSCGVFIFDPKQNYCPVTFLNRAGRDIVGVEACLLGVEFKQFIERLGRSDDKGLVFDTIFQQKPLQKQLKFIGEDGSTSWYDFRLTPVFDERNNLDLYVGVLGDITALKTREAEFFKAQKLDALGQLSAGLAHDFNNILSVVEGCARMIEMNSGDACKVVEYVGKIKGSSSRGAALTKQMMAFARHKVVQDSVTDLKALFEEQEILLRPLMDETVDFTITCGEGDLFGCCDADSIVQILMNFVINACDAMGPGGRLSISLEALEEERLPEFIRDKEREFLCLKVRDDGSGMAPEICEKIFDPFFTTKGQGDGTGLGLSVVYGLVQDMGGYIDVRSEIAVGTEFSVYVPRSHAEPDRKVVSGDVDEASTLHFEGYTALVVEDEVELKAIISEMLTRRGMTVLNAEHGNDALVVQDDYEKDIDVLITDLVMPGIPGVKLGEMIKALRPDIQVLFMSGYPARGQEAKVELPEKAAFMPKPINFDELCVNLHSMLSGDAVQRQIGEAL